LRTHDLKELAEEVDLEELALLGRFARLAADAEVVFAQPSNEADSAAPAS
jgi:hypothetical protein